MKIEIEVDVPEGFEFVRYGVIRSGDWYLSLEGEMREWGSPWLSVWRELIFRKKPRQATAEDVGKRVVTTGMGTRGKLLGVYGDYAWILPESGGAPINKPLDLVALEDQ